MRIVQTFWSGNKSDVLHNSYGWHDANSHIQSWALSCQLLRRLYDEVELYTDEAGYDLLINTLQLPYTKAHIVLDDLNEYPESVWALAKIRTFSLQKTPFIHIDGDVFLWKQFSSDLVNADLIVQNLEIGNRYFEASWNTIEQQLPFIPAEIANHRLHDQTLNLFNFGVFGGNDLDFIQEYTGKAFEFVDKNREALHRIKGLNFNIFFEQYLFYCLVKDRHVARYFERDFVADQYKGLVTFEDAPHPRSYLHMLGEFKQNIQVCRNMSRQLSVEFPKQYDLLLKNIIPNEQDIFNIQINPYSPLQEKYANLSFGSFYQSISFKQRFRETIEKIQSSSKSSTTKQDIIPNSITELEFYIQEVNYAEVTQIFQREFEVNSHLISLTTIDFVTYAQWEYAQEVHYSSFIKNPNDYEFTSASYAQLLEVHSLLITPSLRKPYYNEMILDELDKVILKESQDDTNMQKLLRTMEKYFNTEDLETNYKNYKKLIYGGVKRLAYQKALKVTQVENKILSRRIDTSLECL